MEGLKITKLPAPINSANLDLPRRLQDGDRIIVAQGSGEPVTLTRRLVDASHAVAGLKACIGMLIGDHLTRASSMSFESYGAMALAAQLPPKILEVLPLHYSEYVARLTTGQRPSEVVLLQLSASNGDGSFYLGMGDLHLIEAARHARLVVAEINPITPRTPGTEWPGDVDVHVAVTADTPPPILAIGKASQTELRIARHIAELIPDRAVLQLGIGRLPNAIAKLLCGHRDLGVHSGLLTDAIVALSEAGVLTNATKEIDSGLTVGGLVVGSPPLFSHIDANPSIRIRTTEYTHSPFQIAQLSRFFAINSAVDVDLLGQINAETVKGKQIGGIGGQVDFTRGAHLSTGGRAIVALPSTAQSGTVSRIVPHVRTVTVARADSDTVVTEWGVAELRGLPPPIRAERLIAIADPQFQEELSRQWHNHVRDLDG